MMSRTVPPVRRPGRGSRRPGFSLAAAALILVRAHPIHLAQQSISDTAVAVH
jgi:hypothetical protein